MAASGEEHAVARIVGDASGEGAFHVIAGIFADSLRNVLADVENVDVFQPIVEPHGRKLPERLARVEVEAVVALIVNAADEVGFIVKHLTTDCELVVHEIRFGERHEEIFALGAVLHAGAETLTAAGKTVAPAEQIEVRLLDFSKAKQLINRTKARAEVK